MKYIWYWKWVTKDIEKVYAMSERFEKLLKEHPEKFPKLSEPNFTGRGKGFRLIEAKNEEQLMNLVTFWWPTEKWRLVPCFNAFDIGKAYDKWHK